MITISKTESALRARARRMGYRVTRSRSGLGLDNQGEFMIVNDRNHIVGGDRFDYTLDDVAEFLTQQA